MAFPTGWGRYCAVVIDADQVNGTSHSDFPVLITEDMLPSEMFDADGSYPAINGGGDIRFTSDTAGTTQLPCEIVSFVTDNNPANGTAEIWVKVPTLSGSSDTTIYVWYNATGETQPAVGDTYGRNAVWSNYHLVVHGHGTTLLDSTGGVSGDIATGETSQTGFIGGWGTGWSGGNNNVATPSSFPISGFPFTLQGHAKMTTDTQGALIGWGDSTEGADNFYLGIATGTTTSRWRTAHSDNTSYFEVQEAADWNVNEEYFVAHAYDASGNAYGVHYRDGVKNSATDTGLSYFSDTWDRWGIGCAADASISRQFPGDIDELRIAKTALSADWLDTEWNNQSSPATFATAGTPQDVSGGSSHTLNASDIDSDSQVTSPSIGQKHVLTATDVYSDSQVTSPSVGQNHVLDATDIDSDSAVSSPDVGQNHVLAAADIDSDSQVSSPSLSIAGFALSATDVQSLSQVSSPALGTIHNLLASNIASLSQTSGPSIGQVHILTVVDVDSDSQVSSPTASAAGHSVDATDIESVSQVSSPALGTIHVLTVADVASVTDVSSPILGQVHTLLASDINSLSQVSSPSTVSSSLTLTEDDIAAIVAAMEAAGFLKLNDWLALK